MHKVGSEDTKMGLKSDPGISKKNEKDIRKKRKALNTTYSERTVRKQRNETIFYQGCALIVRSGRRPELLSNLDAGFRRVSL